MFKPIFRKLFWKEFRMLWPLWVSVVALCGLIDLGTYYGFYGTGKLEVRNYGIFLAAAILPMLYALGSAGTQFAWELEVGTFKRLRSLPVTSWQAVWAKMAWTITSTILLAATLWGASFLMTGGGKGISTTTINMLLIVCLFTSLEAIAWGTLVSLRSNSPLIATIIAGALGITASTFATGLGIWIELSNTKTPWSIYIVVWPIRLIVLALLAAVIVYLGHRWFDYWRRRESRDSEHHYRLGNKGSASLTYIAGDGGFLALCQQYWRRNRKLWLIAVLIPILGAILGVTGVFPGSLQDQVTALACWGSWFSCTILASNVFGADQSDQGFRFFAHHGVSTRKVWFSRTFLSGTLILILWCGVGIMLFWFFTTHKTPDRSFMIHLFFLLGVCLFSIGTFFSILCKSRILAWVWTFGLSYVFMIIVVFLQMYEVSIYLILLPLFGLLASSYLGLSDRIHDRSGLRTRLKKISPFVVCTILFFGLIIAQRVLSIPYAEIKPDWIADYKQAQKSPESKRLAKEFRSLNSIEPEKVPVDRPPEWGELQEITDEIDLKTNTQTFAPVPFDGTMPIFSQSDLNKMLPIANSPKEPDWQIVFGDGLEVEEALYIGRIRDYLITTAEYYSRKGEPEKSLDCLLAAIRLSPPYHGKPETSIMVFDLLPRWSTGANVTPELIRKAIHAVENLDPPSLFFRRNIVSGLSLPQEIKWKKPEPKDAGELWLYRLHTLPWEHARISRMYRWLIAKKIELLVLWESYRQNEGKNKNNWSDLEKQVDQLVHESDWIKPQPLLTPHIEIPSYKERKSSAIADISRFWEPELFRRLALTALAIREYQLQHNGALPKSLQEVDHYLTNPSQMAMPCGPAFGFKGKGVQDKPCLQPLINIKPGALRRILYERPLDIDDLAGTPCITLDTKTLCEIYGRFSDFHLGNGIYIYVFPLSEKPCSTTVYPLPFTEKKHEEKKKED